MSECALIVESRACQPTHDSLCCCAVYGAVPARGDFELATTPDGLAAQKSQLEAKIGYLRGTVSEEEELFARWKVRCSVTSAHARPSHVTARAQKENVRRKHNYIPLAVELLSALADKGQLMPLLEAGEAKAKDARERAAKRKADREAEAAASGKEGGEGDAST